MKEDYSLKGILRILKDWMLPIIYATIAIAMVSMIILLLMPNYYKASTTFYAASPDLSQPAPVGGQGQKTFVYGDDTDLDRLFSLSNSSKVYDYLINKYKLYDHYSIDSTSKKAKAKIYTKLDKLYNTLKTEYGAINLTVEDKDPVLARDIANDSREKINQLSQHMVKESQSKTISSFADNIERKQARSIILNDSLAQLKDKYGIYDVDSQGEVIAELITNTEAEMEFTKSKLDIYKNSSLRGARDSVRKYQVIFTSNEKKLSGLNKKVSKFTSGIAIVRKLELELTRLNDQISLDKERMQQLEGSYHAPYSALLIVEEAAVPVDKSRPRRSILLIMVTLAAFVLSVLTAFLIENYRKIDWSELRA